MNDTADILLINEMISYYSGDPKRIQHFVKVYEFAKMIGIMEKIDERELFILRTAAITHDIGIKISEEKYGNCNGKNQEKEGPAIAREMLSRLPYDEEVIKRVEYLIGHHHTYNNIDSMDYQILVEADFIVNVYEDELSKDNAIAAYNRIFKTESGKSIFKRMFLN